MYSHEVQIRVRYGETDKMGYLYYGNYAMYYEVGRVETIRTLGVSYKEMEDNGVMLPVVELSAKFLRPALYDQLLTVKTTITKLPEVRILFDYEITNEDKDIVNIGHTTLVFFDMKKRRPIKAPEEMLGRLLSYFS